MSSSSALPPSAKAQLDLCHLLPGRRNIAAEPHTPQELPKLHTQPCWRITAEWAILLYMHRITAR